jgi:hypothetical protein
METAFVSMICVALIVIGGMTMARGFLTSMDSTSTSIDSISQRTEEIMRTNMSVIDLVETGRDTLHITLQNTGQVKLSEYAKWDVIVHYTDSGSISRVTWLPYVEGMPAGNQWSVSSILTLNDVPEVFEPGIFNTDEKMVMQLELNPQILEDSNAVVVITAPNGVTITRAFVGN